jgi:hypothetical protein
MLRMNTILYSCGIPKWKDWSYLLWMQNFFVDFGPNNPIKTNVLNIFVEYVIIHIMALTVNEPNYETNGEQFELNCFV